MRQIFAIAAVALSAAAIASGQEHGAIRDPRRIVEQVTGNWTTNGYKHRSTRMPRRWNESTLMISSA
jgi:hypothetical protein